MADLTLFDETWLGAPAKLPHLDRVVAASSDRVAWLRARARGITATDAARLASRASVTAVARSKYFGDSFTGNAFTQHGREREPHIARWIENEHGISHNDLLFHAENEVTHLATPDGIRCDNGDIVLAEIKTTTKSWRSIPRSYLRQVWWQQYVLGASRTLVVWERHNAFVPIERGSEWVERDDSQIEMLCTFAREVVDEIRRIEARPI